MYNIENKKVTVSIILIGIFGMILCKFLKEDIYIPIVSTEILSTNTVVPQDYRFIKKVKTDDIYDPVKNLFEYDSHYVTEGVSIIGLEFKYKNIVTFFIILTGVGVYLFLYKTDDEIKFSLFKLNNFLKRGNKKAKQNKSLLIFILTIVIIISLILFWIKYYTSLLKLQRPLNWGESFFVGFSQVFFIVIIVSIIVTIFKFSVTKKS